MIKHHIAHLQSIVSNKGNHKLIMNSFPRQNIKPPNIWQKYSEIVTGKFYNDILLQFILHLFYFSSQIALTGYFLLITDHDKAFLEPSSWEEFENTKGIIIIRKSKKNKQHNGWNKKDKQQSTKHAHKKIE